MTVGLTETAIVLTGTCGVEEVEALADYLERRPELAVDLGGAVQIHTALWQALMIFRPKVIGRPESSLGAGKVLDGLSSYLNEARET